MVLAQWNTFPSLPYQNNAQQEHEKAQPIKQGADEKPGPARLTEQHQRPSHIYQGDCSDPEQADLCAQQRMAAAAEEQALYTGIGLALLLITLFFTGWAAIAASRSAKIAERALVGLERPHVFVEITSTGLAGDRLDRILPTGKFEFRFVNFGRSPAILTELKEDYRTIQGDPEVDLPPPIDPLAGSGRPFPIGVIIAPEGKQEEPFRTKLLNVTEVSRLMRRDHNLFFLGYVRYRDIFGNRYITGYCAVHDRIGNRFVLMGDERYNYTKKDTQRRWWRNWGPHHSAPAL